MALYVVLYKLTEQGIKNVNDSPDRIEKGIKATESRGGKVIGFCSTMDEYDNPIHRRVSE